MADYLDRIRKEEIISSGIEPAQRHKGYPSRRDEQTAIADPEGEDAEIHVAATRLVQPKADGSFLERLRKAKKEPTIMDKAGWF